MPQKNEQEPQDTSAISQSEDLEMAQSAILRRVFSIIVVVSALLGFAVLVLFNTRSETKFPFWSLQMRMQALLASAVFFVFMTGGRFFLGLYCRIFKLQKTSLLSFTGLVVLIVFSLAFFLLVSIVITLAKGYVF